MTHPARHDTSVMAKATPLLRIIPIPVMPANVYS